MINWEHFLILTRRYRKCRIFDQKSLVWVFQGSRELTGEHLPKIFFRVWVSKTIYGSMDFLGESSTLGILAPSANQSTRTYQIVNSMIMIKATFANIVNWLWIHFACRKKKIFTIYKKFFFCSKMIHVPVFIRLENSILVFQQN